MKYILLKDVNCYHTDKNGFTSVYNLTKDTIVDVVEIVDYGWKEEAVLENGDTFTYSHAGTTTCEEYVPKKGGKRK